MVVGFVAGVTAAVAADDDDAMLLLTIFQRREYIHSDVDNHEQHSKLTAGIKIFSALCNARSIIIVSYNDYTECWKINDFVYNA